PEAFDAGNGRTLRGTGCPGVTCFEEQFIVVNPIWAAKRHRPVLLLLLHECVHMRLADDGDAVATLLKCSVDLVRAKGETWGIARVLARDKAGRASRVTYPRALVHAYLVAGTPEND